MLHKLLLAYLEGVEQAIEHCQGVYVERYIEEILTPERVNLKIRLRYDDGGLLEIHEAVIVVESVLTHLDYRYHFQDQHNNLRFRYDCTPHFPDLPNFPYHKHLPDRILDADRPEIATVLHEAAPR